ncbi:hypothetical protein ICN84_09515 [Akkermansia glycaniphila]|uniref:hypothetical protein n=1 Tax=Akkermansia glycaniphila TaxID=1679444 RepID=UPI001C02F30D|nr:hypothetical protein [Akkermansia glycaniphila]MBT9450306.1 hypothetical protein [Akkermansia glycaniphila]
MNRLLPIAALLGVILLPACYNTQTRDQFTRSLQTVAIREPGHIGYRGSDEQYDYFDLRDTVRNIERIRVPQPHNAMENNDRQPIGTYGTGSRTMHPTVACSNNPALRAHYRITEETPLVAPSKILDDVQHLTPGEPILLPPQN